MFDHRAQFDSGAGNALDAATNSEPQESLCCLQYLVAFLLEKNEQIRQELAARKSDERAQVLPFDRY
ncbi:MAG: hypothetical protein WDM87_06340 [Terracidiphilus sp.]